MNGVDVDVAQILEQIKREVREQYLEEQREVPLSRAAALEEVQATSWVNPHQPIGWPHLPKGVGPKLVALLQKAVRRLLRWYINPIVEDQNRFNAAVARAIDALAQENKQLWAEFSLHAADQRDAPGGQEMPAERDVHPGSLSEPSS